MNLASLLTEAQRLAGRVDQDWNTRTRRWLNEAQAQWALEVPWPTLVREETFLAQGTRQLILPQRVARVVNTSDVDNKRPILYVDHWDKEIPDSFHGNVAGAAYRYREVGLEAVARQPAATGALSFRTDASSVFSVSITGTIENTAASGTPDHYRIVRETVSISSSSVHAGTQQFLRIETLGKSDFTPGDVICRDSSSNVIATIASYDFRTQYRRLEFADIPPLGTQIQVRYLVRPPPLVDTTDLPHTSVDTEYLIWYAAGMIHEACSQSDQSVAKLARAKDILQRAIYAERAHGDRDWRALPENAYWGVDDLDVP